LRCTATTTNVRLLLCNCPLSFLSPSADLSLSRALNSGIISDNSAQHLYFLARAVYCGSYITICNHARMLTCTLCLPLKIFLHPSPERAHGDDVAPPQQLYVAFPFLSSLFVLLSFVIVFFFFLFSNTAERHNVQKLERVAHDTLTQLSALRATCAKHPNVRHASSLTHPTVSCITWPTHEHCCTRQAQHTQSAHDDEDVP
jgi:hypothetical protein